MTPVEQLPQAAVDRALASGRSIDSAASALAVISGAIAHDRHLVRRAAASFSTDRERRADLIDALAQAVARTAEPA